MKYFSFMLTYKLKIILKMKDQIYCFFSFWKSSTDHIFHAGHPYLYLHNSRAEEDIAPAARKAFSMEMTWCAQQLRCGVGQR